MLQKIHFGEVGHGAIETWLLQGGHNRGRQNCLSELAKVQNEVSERVPGGKKKAPRQGDCGMSLGIFKRQVIIPIAN